METSGTEIYLDNNATTRVAPEVFAAWMHALREVPDGMLWLFATHPAAQANLRTEAARAGVAPERIIFASRVDNDVHLARLGCADLALDTLPCGSHTTGVDALWAGVPLLTCRGTTFAGRVGASLVAAVGLPDLVANDLEQLTPERFHVLGEQNRRMGPYDSFKRQFPLEQRNGAEVLALVPQTIEGIERRRTATAEQIVELGPSVLIQRHDLTVQNC